jgi:hypothetical protein
MAAGVIPNLMNMADVVGFIDVDESNAPKVRGPYKKRAAQISN